MGEFPHFPLGAKPAGIEPAEALWSCDEEARWRKTTSLEAIETHFLL